MSHDVIVLEHVSRFFRMDVNHTSSLKEYVVNILSGKHEIRKFQALQDVSLHVQKGEIYGIIGRNGAGKSTLLKVISGILKPSQGTCHVLGNIVPMLELGSGFDMELSGLDNVFLNGAILGYSRKFLEEQYKAIIDFSELAEFIEMPLKTYSSGMLARLAFSIATVVKPDILIVDEILAVGDMEFQKKSYARMLELMNGGTTVLLVAHDLEKIKSMCNRTLWLSHGTVRMAGETHAVCNAYAASED